MTTPIIKRSHITILGAAYCKAILVTTKDAPQTVTVNRALLYVNNLELDILIRLWQIVSIKRGGYLIEQSDYQCGTQGERN